MLSSITLLLFFDPPAPLEPLKHAGSHISATVLNGLRKRLERVQW